jgi:hypothetical protein
MAETFEQAITLFERGRTEEAAHLLGAARRSAEEEGDEMSLAEIDHLIGQMEAHLSGGARESFEAGLADDGAARRGELRSIVRSAGVVGTVGAVAILISAFFRWPDTLLYALLLAVAGPLLIVLCSLPVALVNSIRRARLMASQRG